MSPLLKNLLAVFAGFVVGMFVNGGLVSISGSFVPLPEGVDPNDFASINANIHKYSVMHFIMPFLAHALGTLAGAFTAAKIAASHNMKFALGFGVFFLLGGIAASFYFLPSAPTWFKALDLIVAYLPMAYLGGKLAGGNKTQEIV